jgi:hypothetical protein
MQSSIELRLKIRHWFKKYGKILFFLVVLWTLIFIVNKFLRDYTVEPSPNTTYTPSVSVMNPSEEVSSKIQATAESFIEEYVSACNQGKYQKAFAMLSEDCQKYAFDDDVETFASYVLEKMPTPKKYSIQNYSNYGKYYIYEVKYFDDLLATGLTNTEYTFTTEKMTLTKNSEGGYDIATGNYIAYETINNIAENEYLKIDVKDKLVKYSTETYEVKFTNRTDDVIVISDNFVENEVELALSNEYRELQNTNSTIILNAGESKTFWLGFMKFVDDNDEAQNLLFGNVRVLEKYYGADSTADEKQNAIDNAVAKFSMSIPVNN